MNQERTDLDKYTTGAKLMKNFIPTAGRPIERRKGLKLVRYRAGGLWRRVVMWWRGEPTVVSQMITFGQPQVLYVATDRGLFYLDKDQVLKPVPLAMPTDGGRA